LDESPDPMLDPVGEQVVALTGMPIGLLSFVLDTVQLFRSHKGLPPALAVSRATNRCDSFCQIVVQRERPFVVTDARTDTRVSKVLVDAYGIMSYIGVPVRVEGQVIGSVCAIDVVPRSIEVATLNALVDLGERTGTHLTRRLGAARTAALEDVLDLSELGAEIARSANALSSALIDVSSFVQHLRRSSSASVTDEHIASALRRYRPSSRALPDFVEHVRRLASLGESLPAGPPRVAVLRDEVRVATRRLSEVAAALRLVDGLHRGTLTEKDAVLALSVLMQLAKGYDEVVRLVASLQLHALSFTNRPTRDPQRISIQP
jgi:hypothetical protein